ncbi:hypothetical protein BAUCODRAFT_127388 [Baudoinia panamericana UAMH 10762]|uniref:Methyltransferase domain-containing protein n=1 Tax=Baudoinia panamericana (strain UAMH 10762) TaxID=717646 RepID=M2M4I0_BAUPA|nr:uncharacterized protein BAUCODRAFT_127388 [Baudoinia panamericana UAMH 10762]EMC91491.1 hypothetical protein BAUCODRAFT_127388 [Baudoinia panamericana UAMH 10762]
MASQNSSQVVNTAAPNERVLLANERVTGPAAAELILRSGIQTYEAGDYWSIHLLDNATGGGILLEKVFDLAAEKPFASPLKVIAAGDINEEMLDFVRRKRDTAVQSLGPTAQYWKVVDVRKVDQTFLQSEFPQVYFTHIFNNFGIFFSPDSDAALDSTYQTLTQGGVAGFTTWKSIAWWHSIAEPALANYIPEAPTLQTPDKLFPSRGWSDPEAVKAMLEKAGFCEVDVTEFGFTPEIEPEDFTEAMAVLVQVVAKKGWSEQVFERYADQIGPALLKYMQASFPNGRWDGKMTAILAIGRKV